MNGYAFLLGAVIGFPMAGALAVYLCGRLDKTLRDRAAGAVVIAEFLFLILLIAGNQKGDAALELPGICGFGLRFTADGFRMVYGLIVALMWMVTTLASPEYFAHYRNRNRYYLFLLVTLGATQGVFFSADLYTTFVFFEIMSLTSYVWVAQDEKKASLRAAETYLAVAVTGGLVMLMGLLLLYRQAGTLVIAELYEACQGKNVYVAAACLFFGFGAKAGAFPLHIWLPKAHPVAPAPASALLSGVLTKTGIFGILVLSCQILLHDWKWGTFVLIVGTLTMVAGAVLALFSVDFKRTLACSSVSQIGFILVGTGMMGLLGEDSALAARGTMLHMVNHSLFKMVLFTAAGVIYQNLHKLDLNEIRGFGRKKPLLGAVYLAGALGIGGVPLFSGYVSKTLIHESIVEYTALLGEGAAAGAYFGVSDLKIIEWAFLISGGLTVAYMCKLFVAVFVEKNADAKVQQRYDAMKGSYMSRLLAVLLALSALIFPVFGAFPHRFMDRIADLGQGFLGVSAFEHSVAYFSFANLKGALLSLVIGGVIYLAVVRGWMMKRENGVRVYRDCWPRILDLEDYFYRPVIQRMLPALAAGVCRILDGFVDAVAAYLPVLGGKTTGILDTTTDAAVVMLRGTVYRDAATQEEPEEGNAVTIFLGRVVNAFVSLMNRTFWKQRPNRKDYVHRFALAYTSFKENAGLIGRSLSYGLILFCLGLCGTLIYLLISFLSR